MKTTLYNFFILLLVVNLWAGCNKKQKSRPMAEQGQITLLFDTLKDNYDTLKGKWTVINPSAVLTFRPFIQGEQVYSIRKPERDTITIRTKAELVMVSYRYTPINSVDFIVHRGDTIVVNEEQGTPFLTVLGRKPLPYDLNYHFYRKARYNTVAGCSTEDSIAQPQVVYTMFQNIPWQKGIQSARKRQVEEWKDETVWLDSLKQAGLLSPQEYDIYKFRNKYRLKGTELAEWNLPDLENCLKTYDDSLFTHDWTADYGRFYWNCLDRYVIEKIKSEAPSSPIRQQDIYDVLDSLPIPLGALGQKARLIVMENIVACSPITVGQTYYKRFTTQLTDTALLKRLETKYRYLFDNTVNQSADIELLDTHGKRTNWTEVLRKHKGKMIYVDFWASWCAPCKKEMPASHRLREKCVGKDIVFVYLSTDHSEEAWKQCLPEVGLDKVKENYLVLNSRTSRLLNEDLRLKTIPRYLIYDKTGRLIHNDAPRPGDEKTKRMLQISCNGQ